MVIKGNFHHLKDCFYDMANEYIIEKIKNETKKHNKDNISRTNAYFYFYLVHSDIKWSFLASMVSRNAGWNMCDLEGEHFPKIFPESVRTRLFLTYERANWTIFEDAYPQLMIYHYSIKYNKPLFHLLDYFHVSKFMVKEWWHYYHSNDRNRLLLALIINEQNVIQRPVIEHPYFKSKVFHTPLFRMQDILHINAVVFPTLTGRLYGDSVVKFQKVTERIALGKRLSFILFHPELYPQFLKFAVNTKHTGSRYDYEKYIDNVRKPDTPALRKTYPVIAHHWHDSEDWFQQNKMKEKWYDPAHIKHDINISKWFLQKQEKVKYFAKVLYILKHVCK
ncbi:DUF2515 domain-containing protein [Heyndrickxia ginsengihumi]|nr:DUF2515 domain-containing protein [Heyndrickxia ginsengihumi]